MRPFSQMAAIFKNLRKKVEETNYPGLTFITSIIVLPGTHWLHHLSEMGKLNICFFPPTSLGNTGKCTRKHNCYGDSGLWGIWRWIHIYDWECHAQGAVCECGISLITSVLIKWAPEFGFGVLYAVTQQEEVVYLLILFAYGNNCSWKCVSSKTVCVDVCVSLPALSMGVGVCL